MADSSPTIKTWLHFLLGLLFLYLFAVVVLPLMSSLPLARKAIQAIEERDIDPRALFYTESEHAVEAGRFINEKVHKREKRYGREKERKTED